MLGLKKFKKINFSRFNGNLRVPQKCDLHLIYVSMGFMTAFTYKWLKDEENLDIREENRRKSLLLTYYVSRETEKQDFNDQYDEYIDKYGLGSYSSDTAFLYSFRRFLDKKNQI